MWPRGAIAGAGDIFGRGLTGHTPRGAVADEAVEVGRSPTEGQRRARAVAAAEPRSCGRARVRKARANEVAVAPTRRGRAQGGRWLR